MAWVSDEEVDMVADYFIAKLKEDRAGHEADIQEAVGTAVATFKEELIQQVEGMKTNLACQCGRGLSNGLNNGCYGQCVKYYNAAISNFIALLKS